MHLRLNSFNDTLNSLNLPNKGQKNQLKDESVTSDFKGSFHFDKRHQSQVFDQTNINPIDLESCKNIDEASIQRNNATVSQPTPIDKQSHINNSMTEF